MHFSHVPPTACVRTFPDRLSRSRHLLLAVLLTSITLPPTLTADETESSVPPPQIPQQLLKLIHAPEVHAELELSASDIESLEQLLKAIDGDWFRSRNLPDPERIALVEKLQEQARDWFRQHTTKLQQARLLQLELQAQGLRMLLREDLSRELDIQASQSEKLVELATLTDTAQRELQQAIAAKKIPLRYEGELKRRRQDEENALTRVMTASQLSKLERILGATFDVAGLKRIYPLAPELVPVEQWINSAPLTLESLRGKVVLLHFYAFQCSNCKANFDVYNRWHEKYADDVVVLGIQTPETATERDPDAVRQAASNAELRFPVMIDLKSENWKNWSNTMWPTVYVIDKRGYLRLWWQGELRWEGATGDQTIEDLVDELLREEL